MEVPDHILPVPAVIRVTLYVTAGMVQERRVQRQGTKANTQKRWLLDKQIYRYEITNNRLTV